MINTNGIEAKRQVGLITIRIAEAMQKGWGELNDLGFTIDPSLEKKPLTRFMVNYQTKKIYPYSAARGTVSPLWKIKAIQRRRELELLSIKYGTK